MGISLGIQVGIVPIVKAHALEAHAFDIRGIGFHFPPAVGGLVKM